MDEGNAPFAPAVTRRSRRRLAQAAVEVLAMLLLGAASVAWWTGGWRAEVLGITLSARGAGRLIIFALGFFAVRAALIRDGVAPARELSDAAARVVAGALLVAGLLAWASHQSPYVGGADSYGYVSAAQRIRDGTLIQREPLAEVLPYANAIEVATPLGYVATARQPNASVPAYPLGLPAIMAAAWSIAGPRAPFLVAPLIGLVLVFACSWIVYRWSRDLTLSLAAGAAVAFHPLVFTYAIQPMSDVPAAGCYLLAAAFLLGAANRAHDAAKAAPPPGARLRVALAGVAASAAFLIRPALIPGAAALAVIPLMQRHQRRAHVAIFLLIIGIGVALQALSQWYLYGDPRANGYGPANELFALAFLPANARSYARWGVALHGWVWIAGLVIAIARIGSLASRVTLALPLLVAAAPYAVYRTYDHWETLRFALPLLVGATVAAVAALFVTARRWLPRSGTWVALVLVVLMIAHWVRWLDDEHVFQRSFAEERFARAGELVLRVTPTNAVVLASLHSGSLRYYTQRQTLDWAEIPMGQFDATVAALKKNGYAVFVMLDGEEQKQFAERHGNVLDLGRWLPSGQVRDIRMYEAP